MVSLGPEIVIGPDAKQGTILGLMAAALPLFGVSHVMAWGELLRRRPNTQGSRMEGWRGGLQTPAPSHTQSAPAPLLP